MSQNLPKIPEFLNPSQKYVNYVLCITKTDDDRFIMVDKDHGVTKGFVNFPGASADKLKYPREFSTVQIEASNAYAEELRIPIPPGQWEKLAVLTDYTTYAVYVVGCRVPVSNVEAASHKPRRPVLLRLEEMISVNARLAQSCLWLAALFESNEPRVAYAADEARK